MLPAPDGGGTSDQSRHRNSGGGSEPWESVLAGQNTANREIASEGRKPNAQHRIDLNQNTYEIVLKIRQRQ